ncbi:acetylcholinesterase-like [Vespula squamosa]|uniref:Acetylcholinesterase-like n=1 Tax=Vespula squamosa TaxID=30214 RepID=A0ABD2AQD2_VESSQ
MRSPFSILLVFIRRLFYICIIFERISFVYSQNTYARQGLARDPPIVRIPDQGALAGKEVIIGRGQKVIQYLGIPYSQPPIGQLRFSIPVTDPLPSWKGIRNASQYGPSCQQVSNRLKLHEKLYARLLPPNQPDPGMSEDCLFLNIFVPDGKRPPEGWPVMVWFHSGDFNTGTPKIWDASIFVTKQKVLVITVAYRLNILGFFTSMDSEAPGNYGMFDQIAALDWIQKNIERFEGSPSNVIIYGHSSGAICVGLHMMSPLSRGKFSKAIAMSGDAIGSVGSPQTELPIVDAIADKFGCYRRPTTKLMECLRRVDVSVLVELSSDIETWGPIVDAETNNGTEPFLPEHPRDILAGGNYNAVPLIVGYTKNEQSLAYIESMTSDELSDGTLSEKKFESMIIEESSMAVNNIYNPEDNNTCETKPEILSDAILFYYKPYPPNDDQGIFRDKYLELQTDKSFASGLTLLAGELSKQETSFVYRFDYRPKTDLMVRDVPEWAGVPHMFDLPFVWGLPLTTTLQWNPADKKMSEVMMMMLANFAKTANPSLNNVKWNPYTVNDPGILIIDRNVDMNEPNVIDYRAFAFWNEYYPKLLEEATNNCCNVTTSAATRSKLSFQLFLNSLIVMIIISLYTNCFIH